MTLASRLKQVLASHWRFGLFLLILASVFLTPVKDADLGWHLRYGQLFWETGKIVKANLFSYTLPDYVWTNHSWGYDVLLYPLFKIGGFGLLSIVQSVLITFSAGLLLSRVPSLSLKIAGSFVLLLFTLPILDGGLKSQSISLFLAVVVWMTIRTYLEKPRQWILFFFPVLFLVWANLHGQFLLGLVTAAGLAFFTKNFKKMKNHVTRLRWVIIGSIAVTLVNPYGFKLWVTALSHFASPRLQTILEWQPWPLLSPLMLLYIFYMIWLGRFVWKDKTMFSGEKLILLIMAGLSLRSRRIIPFFVFLSIPAFTATLKPHFDKLKPLPSSWFPVGAVVTFLAVLWFRHPLTVFSQSWQSYCGQEVRCSVGLAEYMRQNQITGKIFNAYRLGGHLIYAYPEVKYYIDGRMVLWETEGKYVYDEYRMLIQAGAGAREVFMEHHFDYAVLNREYPLTKILEQTERWPVLYQDEFVVLLGKPIP